MDSFVIHSKSLDLTFDRQYGNLIAVSAPNQQWDVLDRPHLGRNWELLVPMEGRRNNPVHGYKHCLASLDVSPHHDKAVMRWEGVASEHGGELDINIQITVEVKGDAVCWSTVVENRSGAMVENLYSPIIGDIRPAPGAVSMESFVDGYSCAMTGSMWPVFHNFQGYWGVDVPTQFREYSTPPVNPYYLIKADNNMGLYFGAYENHGLYMTWRQRLFPGFISQTSSRVPAGDFIGGKEVYLPFDIAHLCFIAPGETLSLTPVHIQAYSGDWKAGVDIYRKHREEKWSWKKPAVPQWALKPHSWLQLHINSPEDELRLRFTQLPDVARECAKYGISAIQLVGWNHGGQDGGNPSHDPDPRLGTFTELKDAIAQCHQIGVKIILFSKFTWADMTTEWYKNELHQYAIRDMHGLHQWHGGYLYQTATQFAGANAHRFAVMCFASQKLRAIMQKEFQKILDLGPAGMLYDESQHHGPAQLCFADDHGHRWGELACKNDNLLIEEFRQMVSEDFLMAGEACYDYEMNAYDLAYFRTYGPDEIQTRRFMRPRNEDGLYMIAVTGFDDQDMINRCLLHNYIVSYEPYFFKGMPSDMPLTMEYGMKMQQLREETAGYIWYGEFMEKAGAKVTAKDGKAHAHYNVFKRKDGKLAVAVANYTDEELHVQVMLDQGSIRRWKAIGGEWKQGDTITLSPHYAIVALEE